ncbi:MAG: cytidine deaminase [Bacilli bacterium]|nr:cytidine deaminase [Bacilli bacterium]
MEEKLKELLNNAYAPYSNYKVASLAVMHDGQVFSGVNVENASYGATICAERNAINTAIANGYKKGDFKAIYIMNDSNKLGFPCFLCRQTMSEFFNDDCDIYLYTKNGLEKNLKSADLITNPFTSENINI